MRMARYFSLIILLGFFLQGCFLASAIESIRQSGVTKDGRMSLLKQDMKKFSEALHWGDPQAAMYYVTEEGKQGVAESLEDLQGDVRVVESKVHNVQFDEDAFQANVKVSIKFYKIPFYVVNDLKQDQVWKFSHSGGWLLDSTHSTQALKG